MPAYAAFLRGINLARTRRLAMADLREILTGLGYEGVTTHLQSGNAVFRSPVRSPGKLERAIASAIEARAGFEVPCLVRTKPELDAVVAGHPFAEKANNGSRMMVLFLSAEPDPGLLAAHDPTALAPADIQVSRRAIYQWCPTGVLEAPAVSAFVEKHLGVTVTARNWNTVTRLTAMVDELAQRP